MARILVTGASGFIGSALASALVDGGACVRGVSRMPLALPGVENVIVGDLSAKTNWRAALEGVDTVVHLAGPAHARFAEYELKAQISDATGALVAQAEAAGVSRFIYVSSIKAVAPRTYGNHALVEAGTPQPGDAYGRAKLAAEAAVRKHPTLRPIILRPPLVHGPSAKANFANLLRLADTPLPLPYADVRNRRSVLALSSFIAAIRALLAKPDGPAGVFHLADAPALSTGEIIGAVREGLGRKSNLFAAPWIATLGPDTLTESLAIDDSAFRSAYDLPPTNAVALLTQTARAWKARI
ncbi:NAD-dependent epimerase/dehydratase family protein [Vitreimonas flagellata]|uniref:NAD-dependent epimerase/dehydratase family protein n=1 Tax=Vitreimonas flagellata TaxID=2560861 RepID=UPI0010757A89|nr:NAD-dependent epimerase/dehydratase family protein [Vitreimonas flagellata]